MATTVLKLITGSLRLIGAIEKGELPDNDEAQDAMDALNGLIDSWGAERSMSNSLIRETLTLTANKASYTIGTGMDLNTTMPSRIDNAFIRDTGNQVDTPLDIFSDTEYNAISDKTVSTGLPVGFYFDRTQTQETVPSGTIYFYPIPDKNYQFIMESLKGFNEFVNLTDIVTFPLHYTRALRYNLAIELAPEYGVGVSPEVAMIAEESLNTIKVLNAEPVISFVQFGNVTRRYNIQSDS